MSRTDNGADPRTTRSLRTAPPTRRGVLAAGAGAGAAALLGATGATTEAQATPSAAPGPTPAPAATPAADLAPYASYWFPDSLPHGAPGPGITWRSLKQWTPESDPDLAYNTATVPLAPRFTPVPPNAGARTGQARISSLVSFGPTARNPPRAPRPPTTTL